MQSRGPEGNALIGTLLAISWILVGLRVYVRCFMSKSFGGDDWLLLAALVTYTTYCSCGLAAIVHGVGRHPSDIPKEDLPQALYFWWLATIFYTLTTVLVRASISVFLNKLCVSRAHKIIVWGTMAVVIAFSTFYIFLAIFQCNPPSYFWERYLGKTGTCINSAIFPGATYAHSTISAIADWILGLLPLWLIWDLQMNFRTKISVGIILGMGVIAGVAAIIRIPYVRILGLTDEFLYATVDVSLWSIIEAALGLIAAAASALRPLFKRFYHLSGYATHPVQRSQTLRYQDRGGYIRKQSAHITDRDRFATRSLDKGDSLELGVGSESLASGGILMHDRKRDVAVSSSEENLTGTGDIHVHTVIEVNTDSRGRGSVLGSNK